MSVSVSLWLGEELDVNYDEKAAEAWKEPLLALKRMCARKRKKI